MYLNYLVDAAFLLAGLWVTLARGPGIAFARVYLPALLLISRVPPIPISVLPQINAQVGALYGIVAGMLLSGQGLDIPRWNLVDGIMMVIALCTIASAGVTEHVWTSVSVSGQQMVDWVGPYLLARVMFNDSTARSAALKTLMACVGVLTLFAIIEARLWPYIYSRSLQTLGLFDDPSVEVLHRYALFRAEVAFRHPIDLGNVSVLLLGMIAMLAGVTEIGLSNPLVLFAMLGTLISLVAAISFTSYVAILAGLGIFAVLYGSRTARAMLRFIVILVIAGLCLTTYWLLNRHLEDPGNSASALKGSLWIRTLIVQNSWKMASTAGLFGWGKTLDGTTMNLESVDNAYILTVLWRGWVTLGLWLLLPIILGKRVSRAMRMASSQRQVLPLAVGVSTILGTMVGMYTVWFGYVYANLFVIMIGFTVTLTDMFFATQVLPMQARIHVPMRAQVLDARPALKPA